MTPLRRAATNLGLLALLAGAALWAWRPGSDLHGAESICIPGTDQRLEDESCRAARLQILHQVIICRFNTKAQIAADVAEERLPLPEAICRFRVLRRERQPPPPRSEAEDAAEGDILREILSYVGYILRDQPDRVDAVVARLESQVRVGVRLPGP